MIPGPVRTQAPFFPAVREDLRTHPSSRNRRADLLVCVFLCVATLVIYGRTGGFSYINFDDTLFLGDNPVVQQGLTWQGVRYAFTRSVEASNYYIPLVWLSHMAVVSLFGMSPGAAHMVNALLHAINAMLCFAAFFSLTGKRRESALIAALFAVHPMHVESVAWVTERKDLLAGLFFMLTLLAYSRYAKRPGFGPYVLVFSCFLLGLLSKPILVVIPCVMLLLDFWPLGRWKDPGSGLRLAIEKLPFLLPLAVSTILALHFQKSSGGLYSFEEYPFGGRVAAMATGYLWYLCKAAAPVNLSVNYPYPFDIPAWQTAGALCVLAAVTACAFVLRRRAPWLLVGWLWFAGVLFPVSGIFVIGTYAVADRYAYLSYPGLYLALVMTGSALAANSQIRRESLAALAAALLAALGISAWLQTGYWKNSATVWSRSVAVNKPSPTAFLNLGEGLLALGLLDQAETASLKALALDPLEMNALNNLGIIFARKGDLEMALTIFQAVVDNTKGFAVAENNLATTKKLIAEKEAAEHPSAAKGLPPGSGETGSSDPGR
ncbi:MAG: hypothetical protein AB1921_16155 [Thermodesulfobacteriota bacterium]